MAIYTVHAPPGAAVSEETADAIQFIKDGFAVGALLLPILWLLWHRLWLALLGYLAVVLALILVDRFVGETAAGAAGIAFALWFALEAREIRRWTLERRGWRTVGIVDAASREAAEIRFFDGWFRSRAATPPPAADGEPPVSSVEPAAAAPLPDLVPVPVRSYARPRPAPSGIIGLFPDTKGR